MPVLEIEMLLANGNGARLVRCLHCFILMDKHTGFDDDSKQVLVELNKNRRVDTLVVVLKGEMKC